MNTRELAMRNTDFEDMQGQDIQDCKSSMASVSIIASTNQVNEQMNHRNESEVDMDESASIESATEESVPYMDDLNALAKASYRLSPGNNGKILPI